MSDRYTRKDCEAYLDILARLCGKEVATEYGQTGRWFLDYQAAYGGYVVAEYTESAYHNGIGEEVIGHGESHPLIDRRLSAREFCEYVNFVSRCMAVKDAPAQQAAWSTHYGAGKPFAKVGD